MKIKTKDLVRDDRIYWPDHTDYVLTVEFPDEPAVVAKVLVKRLIQNKEVYTFFFAGIEAIHDVGRDTP